MKDLIFGDLVGISTGAISDGLIKAVYLSELNVQLVEWLMLLQLTAKCMK